jgi:hypothetical protein
VRVFSFPAAAGTHIWVRNNGTGTFHGYPGLGPG